MKKLCLTLCLTLCLILPAHAAFDLGQYLEKIPMKQGIAYSIPDEAWVPMSSFSLIKKWGLSADVGYVGKDKLVCGVSYELGKLEKFAEVPILEYIDFEIGAYYGLEGINKMSAGEDYGLSFKLLEVKF